MLNAHTLIWLALLLTATPATRYECLPYPEKSLCVLDFLYYHPGDDPIAFPAGYDHYRITSRSERQHNSNVSIFDADLYEAMDRPSRIEMANMRMRTLILPSALHLGNFAENSLSSVTVKPGRNYQITYLDLESNYLKDITFLGSLVNLEILHLERNHVSAVPGSAFASLTKLKYLYFQHNSFTSIPWEDLPRSLMHLDCAYNAVESTEFFNVSLPAMEYLSLQHNFIATINVSTLLRVAPRLKEAHLQNVGMTDHELNQIQEVLTSNNISFVDSPWLRSYCMYDDDYEYIDGRCVQRRSELVGTGTALLLSGVVIGLAATFVYLVVLTYRHMNR